MTDRGVADEDGGDGDEGDDGEVFEISRRSSRERAIALLYEAEVKGEPIGELVAGLPLPPDAYTGELLAGVGEHVEDIDELLRRYARDWSLERMAALDRAVLRLSTYELLHRPEVPLGAVITEAVELAKAYSTEDSARFVNGMLSAIAADHR